MTDSTKKIMTIVGARPQFIKAAVVSRSLRKAFHEVLVHTGQHYDDAMSAVFFDELGIPAPDYHLGVGSGTHARQTGEMMVGIERTALDEKPDLILVYGDTNSTLAGALVAAKLTVPLAHVEAGLRSFNRTMPEEINRMLADRCADLLFCPTEQAAANLKAEGIIKGVHQTGDVMFDAALWYGNAAERSDVLNRFNVVPGRYLLATVHRAASTDNRENLSGLVEAFLQIREDLIWPVHPRTRKQLEAFGLWDRLPENRHLQAVDPIGYLDMIQLEKHARLILTDSGGVQKEAFFYDVPCVTLRDETEWVETVEAGWNRLSGVRKEAIIQAVETFSPSPKNGSPFGDGHAGETIVEIIQKKLIDR
jgi:UDP-N-acetylglucosamine 2-epimerase